MILATVKVADFDRFLSVFSTKGLEKRKQHGSSGARVFRDPNEESRAWVLVDVDAGDWENFMSDPEMAAVFQEGGIEGRPQAAEFVGQYEA